jgi:DNA-binding NarL/FixJ family response regulator
MKDINVGIADDHSLFREGIRMIISDMPGITLSLEATSGEDLLAQLVHATPDVVLLDLEMKGMSGMDALKIIRDNYPNLKVIILSLHTEPRMISHLMKLGANGYLIKDARKNELETAIREAYEKGITFNEQMANSLLTDLRGKSKKPTLSVALSTREKEVLELICQEHTTNAIAEKLFISERTVEGHRKNICAKLDVKNSVGLVKKAIALNLIELS